MCSKMLAKILAVVVLSTLMLDVKSVEAAKITMLHMFGGSHHMTTRVIGEELARRGHEVSICAPGKKSSRINNLSLIGYDGGVSKQDAAELSKSEIARGQGGVLQITKGTPKVLSLISQLCEKMVLNQDVINSVKDSDLVVLEVMLFCAPAFVKRYGKPFVAITPVSADSISGPAFRIPLNPSYIPFFDSHHHTDKMEFGQRVANLFQHKLFPYIIHILTKNTLSRVTEVLNLPSETNFYMMMNEAQILIGSCDPVSDFPSPLMPNTFCVGGFLTQAADKLPAEVESIANATDGFILVTMGTVFNTLTREQVRRITSAFGRLKENVIWQLQDRYDITLPQNVYPMKWVPQNDLLGHSNMKLFVSHVGTSSLQQAVYHGVPVLAIPRAADQWGNGYKLSRRVQMAEVINIETITGEELFDKIQLMLSTDRYRINAQKASRRIKTRKQTPMQKAGDLIEYVIDNDYDVSHLRAHALELPWYIHDMWDVYLFLLVIFHLFIIVTYCCVRGLIRLCMKRKIKSE